MFARNPAWTQDEEILLLDLYLRIGPRPPEDPDVIALSEFLQRLPIHSQEMRAPTFRNATGVSMKLRNVRHVDRRLPAGGLARGSALAERIWEEFAGEPERLAKVAHAIRSAVNGAGGVWLGLLRTRSRGLKDVYSTACTFSVSALRSSRSERKRKHSPVPAHFAAKSAILISSQYMASSVEASSSVITAYH
jgi:hypothetical protein